TILFLILFLTGLDLWAQNQPNIRQVPRRIRPTNSAPPATMSAPPAASMTSAPAAPATTGASDNTSDNAAPAESSNHNEVPAYTYNFQGVDVNQVLDIYAQLIGRTPLRAGLPSASIVLKTESPLTKSEAIEALQAVLSLNGISVVNVGDKFVKVLPVDQANSAGAPFNNLPASELPDVGTYVTHIVQLKYVKPSAMVPVIQPFAKLPNAILPIDDNGILVLRDNAENVKRMLEMINQVDVSVPAVYVSEVIPIKYALAEDIANALNSLGGSGSSTVSFGTAPSQNSTTSGVSGRNGTTGMQGNGFNQQQRTGQNGGTTPNGTPTGGTTFQQRLNSIIQRASTGGQADQIQVFGQAKIIADQRANAILVFATEPDMERIKAVVAKLDVLLSQVLIESVIMDVTLGNTFSFGVSAAQNPKTFSSNPQIIGGGGFNNSSGGSTFSDFINNAAAAVGTNAGSSFANSLGSGFSYFGNIGPNFDVAVQAAESDNSATIIQRPRIQTSQAKPASFFVGQTVPYITSTYNGGSGFGNSSSYSQLSVGVELDVTPFINPDGLVVMDINQEVDDVSGFTSIDGNDVPNTDKRTFSSEIAVKDRDTIILGGFVRADKSHSRSGVPFLQDIPLLGALFSQRNSDKHRNETLILMRPTVLRTPEVAAAQAIKEEQRLPGIAHAEADDDREAQKLIDAERAAEIKAAKSGKHNAGVFTVEPSNPAVTDTNTVPKPNPATGLY
ncbi:MAG TPA: secretin N-terminal domain-containing protein, partial [Verrucomicrobiae bacterium]|nr:secretin N-terminal domain-containing protein [Verrucomicrobiae bacterium]